MAAALGLTWPGLGGAEGKPWRNLAGIAMGAMLQH